MLLDKFDKTALTIDKKKVRLFGLIGVLDLLFHKPFEHFPGFFDGVFAEKQFGLKPDADCRP